MNRPTSSSGRRDPLRLWNQSRYSLPTEMFARDFLAIFGQCSVLLRLIVTRFIWRPAFLVESIVRLLLDQNIIRVSRMSFNPFNIIASVNLFPAPLHTVCDGDNNYETVLRDRNRQTPFPLRPLHSTFDWFSNYALVIILIALHSSQIRCNHCSGTRCHC